MRSPSLPTEPKSNGLCSAIALLAGKRPVSSPRKSGDKRLRPDLLGQRFGAASVH